MRAFFDLRLLSSCDRSLEQAVGLHCTLRRGQNKLPHISIASPSYYLTMEREMLLTTCAYLTTWRPQRTYGEWI
eukprot:6695475-Pyramimonas_sp.AAC.1